MLRPRHVQRDFSVLPPAVAAAGRDLPPLQSDPAGDQARLAVVDSSADNATPVYPPIVRCCCCCVRPWASLQGEKAWSAWPRTYPCEQRFILRSRGCDLPPVSLILADCSSSVRVSSSPRPSSRGRAWRGRRCRLERRSFQDVSLCFLLLQTLDCCCSIPLLDTHTTNNVSCSMAVALLRHLGCLHVRSTATCCWGGCAFVSSCRCLVCLGRGGVSVGVRVWRMCLHQQRSAQPPKLNHRTSTRSRFRVVSPPRSMIAFRQSRGYSWFE